ncbi:MAG: hypothetical protein RL662_1750 [Bacteroidota bacterium]|jgi:adenylosuccinate synthase
MFTHRSFLVLGGGAADIVSLAKGGHELLHCSYSFQQGVDDRGKATTRVYGGNIQATLSQLPPKEITAWALDSRKYQDGMIVILNNENVPVQKIIFENAACVALNLDYIQSNESYITSKITIVTEVLIVGNGIDFLNEWTF